MEQPLIKTEKCTFYLMNITENIIYIILENGTKKRATYLYTSIRLPKISANSDKIVFRKDYQMYVYDLGSKSTKKLTINSNNHFTHAKKNL